jgi:DNA-binding LytR/AlgR family response regulator
MNILIVEDEPFAAQRLEGLIRHIVNDIQTLQIASSVAGAVKWLQSNAAPDLLFCDIHLGDGLSFEIMEQVKVTSPIIFTTAYDQYAIQAFKHNSVDYLLKPIDETELKNAIDKFRHQKQSSSPVIPLPDYAQLVQMMQQMNKPSFKDRFTVKVGPRIKIIQQNEILYFFSFQKGTFIRTIDSRNHLIENTLEVIEQLIDPALYFRINRKYIVSLQNIAEIITESSSRLKLKMPHQEEDDLIVARERVKEFKDWIEG